MSVQAKAGDLEAYLEADVAFHRTLLQASGNEMLAALTTVVAEVLAGRTHHDLMPARPNPEAIRLHGDVACAVQAGDADAAATAMRAIIDEATTAMQLGDRPLLSRPSTERPRAWSHLRSEMSRRPAASPVGDVRSPAREGTSGDARSTSAPVPQG